LVQPEVTTRGSAQMPPSDAPNSTPAPDSAEDALSPLQHTALRTANAGDFVWSDAITVFLPPDSQDSEPCCHWPLAAHFP
jgi:hypothetical protein